MYRLLTSRRFRLPFSVYRVRISSSTSTASVRMVSTKTIPVCDEDSLKDGEMWVEFDRRFRSLPTAHPCLVLHTHSDYRKEVDFGSGKVLVAKIGDKVYATSAFCSHYGAQLAQGVLVKDGRIVW
jgi:hypothetical protein